MALLGLTHYIPHPVHVVAEISKVGTAQTLFQRFSISESR